MTRQLRQWLGDALLSARRAWRTTVLALVVIATATAVLGLSLAFSHGVGAAVTRLTTDADLSVFLDDSASEADRTNVADHLRRQPGVTAVTFVTRADALQRFTRAFPDLAAGMNEDLGALPVSFDVSFGPEGTASVRALVDDLRTMPAVADVRYDQEWADRVARVGTAVTRAGLVLGLALGLAAWTMLYAVVRLSYVARRDEIDILYLVGAPLPAIRGPFLVEGVLQGLAGALGGLLVLRMLVPMVGARLTAASTGLGFSVAPHLPASQAVMVVVAASLAGALAAGMALRDAERPR